jgi:hypothetical protein
MATPGVAPRGDGRYLRVMQGFEGLGIEMRNSDDELNVASSRTHPV